MSILPISVDIAGKHIPCLQGSKALTTEKYVVDIQLIRTIVESIITLQIIELSDTQPLP